MKPHDEYTPPAWHADAKCANYPDPRRWDVEDDKRLRRADRLVLAQLSCLGCPVAAECAGEALDVEPVGVVRAGIPLPLKPKRAVLDALAAIAAGVPPVVAAVTLADPARALGQFAPAHGRLARLARRRGHDVPAPAPEPLGAPVGPGGARRG